jgi:hypothetical protein
MNRVINRIRSYEPFIASDARAFPCFESKWCLDQVIQLFGFKCDGTFFPNIFCRFFQKSWLERGG